MKKGSKYIRKSRIDNWSIGAGFLGIGVLGLFIYLSMIGGIDITEYSYTENCAGTVNDPCYLFMTFTANQDVYIKANDTWLDTAQPIKSLKLQRSWGQTWRTIDLNKTWNKNVKYAIKFSKGKTYTLRFVAMKDHPQDVIDWAINPKGQWKGGLVKLDCKYKSVFDYEYDNVTCTDKEKYSSENKTNYIERTCKTKKVKVYKDVCEEKSKKFTYADDSLEYEKENIGCTAYVDKIICDDGHGADGNGDGICQPGETCRTYNLDEGIELVKVENGKKDITKKFNN